MYFVFISGDRQFMVINRERANAEANNKFLVIQEDEAPRPGALPVRIQDSQLKGAV